MIKASTMDPNKKKKPEDISFASFATRVPRKDDNSYTSSGDNSSKQSKNDNKKFFSFYSSGTGKYDSLKKWIKSDDLDF